MKLPVLSKKIAQGILLLFALAVGTVCIRAQTIQTFAGNGSPALTGYGGPATAAGIGSYPNGVTVDGPGNVYIATSFRILKVNTSGTISLIAGYGSAGFSGDGGPATMARMDGAHDIAVDGAGNVYFSDDGNGRVRKVDIFGIISTFAGISSLGSFSGDGGPATAAGLSALRGLAVDASGNVYLADGGNHRIRKVNTSGIISTIAGNGGSGYSGDGGPATAAAIGNPSNLTFDGAGNLYFTDLLNNLVRKISASGTISAIAGNGTAGYSGDGGPATVAALNGAMGIALDAAGNIYVGDLFNNRVRKINTSGIISTYAGTGIGAYGGDGGPATAAMLRYPCGVATDGSGNIVYSGCK